MNAYDRLLDFDLERRTFTGMKPRKDSDPLICRAHEIIERRCGGLNNVNVKVLRSVLKDIKYRRINTVNHAVDTYFASEWRNLASKSATAKRTWR